MRNSSIGYRREQGQSFTTEMGIKSIASGRPRISFSFFFRVRGRGFFGQRVNVLIVGASTKIREKTSTNLLIWKQYIGHCYACYFCGMLGLSMIVKCSVAALLIMFRTWCSRTTEIPWMMWWTCRSSRFSIFKIMCRL